MVSDLVFTANYNKNLTTNVDTSAYEYNWAGDKHLMNSRGEQSYQHTRSDNNNWNGTVTLNYPHRQGTYVYVQQRTDRLPPLQHLTADKRGTDGCHRQGDTQKHCRPLLPPDAVRTLEPVCLRGKHYNQYVAGPIATDKQVQNMSAPPAASTQWGTGPPVLLRTAGCAGQTVLWKKPTACLPSRKMFGNEDLEMGDMGIKPEKTATT